MVYIMMKGILTLSTFSAAAVPPGTVMLPKIPLVNTGVNDSVPGPYVRE